MKTRDQIIEELARTCFVENYARKIAKAADMVYFEDIVGDLWLAVCELPVTLVTEIYNKCGIDCFRKYVSGVIYRQMRSTNSKVFRRYKKHAFDTIPASQVENIERIWDASA